jgi:hypothetical protein
MANFQLTDADRAVFSAVAAAKAPPGTIVRDFEALLSYLGADGIPVSPKECEFAIARLPELNSLLTYPVPIGLSRGRQASYPHVDGLHLLLRFSRLGRIDRSRSTPRMVLDTAMLAKWQLLNPTEQYFSLLERWWHLADGENDLWGSAAGRFAEYRYDFLKRKRPHSGASKQESPDPLSYLLGSRQIALMQLFGLLDIESEAAVVGRGWKIKRMAATRWGLSASATYLKASGYSTGALLERLLVPSVENSAATEELSDADAGLSPFYSWAKVVLPSFPAWRNILGGVDAVEPFRGSMTFKVSLGQSVWRRIVVPAASSFEDLAEFILDTFEFDDEHLYQFRYQDEYASLRMLADPRCSDVYDDCADEVTLGEAGLLPGQLVEFRYDFGDNWRFKVLLEKRDASEGGGKPEVLAEHGKAPQQYQ